MLRVRQKFEHQLWGCGDVSLMLCGGTADARMRDEAFQKLGPNWMCSISINPQYTIVTIVLALAAPKGAD